MLGFAVLIGGVLLCFRLVGYLGVAILVLGVGGIAFYFWQGRHWVSGYERAHVGQTERDIVALLGIPPRVTDGTEWVEPGVKKVPSAIVPGCVKELWYNEFLFPAAFSFCFDSESRLLSKYYWSSW
jgi:hypothetical protein